MDLLGRDMSQEYRETLKQVEHNEWRKEGEKAAHIQRWKTAYTRRLLHSPTVAMAVFENETDDIVEDKKRDWVWLTLRPPNRFTDENRRRLEKDFQEFCRRFRNRTWVGEIHDYAIEWAPNKITGVLYIHMHIVFKLKTRYSPSHIIGMLRRGRHKEWFVQDASIEIKKKDRRALNGIAKYCDKDKVKEGE